MVDFSTIGICGQNHTIIIILFGPWQGTYGVLMASHATLKIKQGRHTNKPCNIFFCALFLFFGEVRSMES